MTGIILAFLGTGFGKIVVGIFAAIIAAGAAYLRGRSSGKHSERNKQARAKVKSLEDQLEMDREATEAEKRAAGMTDEEARAEALKWSKH